MKEFEHLESVVSAGGETEVEVNQRLGEGVMQRGVADSSYSWRRGLSFVDKVRMLEGVIATSVLNRGC